MLCGSSTVFTRSALSGSPGDESWRHSRGLDPRCCSFRWPAFSHSAFLFRGKRLCSRTRPSARWALRLLVKRDEWRRLDSNYSIDRLLSWLLLGAFVLFAVYGSFSGIARELEALGSEYNGFNLAGFPLQEALALGSWIVLGLL